MKHFLLLLLLALGLLSGAVAAATLPADTAVLRITRLPAGGLLLRQGWRYHAGDDPAWARPDFDASAWDTVAVARSGFPLPLRTRTGAGWFRLRLRLADSLRTQALSLRLSQELAGFEVYADGRRVGHYGTFSADPAQVRTAGLTAPPVDLVLAGPELVVAVRFAPWSPPPFLRTALANNKLLNLELRLCTRQSLTQDNKRQQGHDVQEALVAGLFWLLGLLHVAFFYYNPARRANAYFAFYALVSATNYTLQAFHPGELTLEASLAIRAIRFFLENLAMLAGLRVLYALFEVRPGWVYASLSVGACLLVPWNVYSLFTGNTGFLDFMALFALVALQELRLTWQAVRRRQRGSLVVGSGLVISLLTVFLLFALVTLFPHLEESAWFVTVFIVLYQLSAVAPVLAISLYLAREFALDAELLQVKLGEVERLSAQTLAQEQEKQVLLARQNDTLEQQVSERTGELQRSLTELRTTQAQLIQKEKMASLGELTAGIAHEIQNPLNFVNNFAEVSAELVAELREERAKGAAADKELEEDLLTDLDRNLIKISQHGQRAAGIVRGMLEHSRASTGERQPTDVNALCDEYLRLAYHGLRAKDKSFNAELKTDFAPGLPLVEGVGADLGRVLLNLFNNAFYAVQQRQLANTAGYVPTVSVATMQVGQQVEVRVRDNGTGMSPEVQAKIFQPFFTTKPTGEGTGLGLSLAHDIITQGHGGTLSVESHEGQGTTFTISLPLASS